jgi:hypothetical protein
MTFNSNAETRFAFPCISTLAKQASYGVPERLLAVQRGSTQFNVGVNISDYI